MGVSLRQTYSHLFDSYGHIDEQDIKDSNIRMMKLYSPETPIIELVDQFKCGKNFVALGEEVITSSSLVTKRITLLAHTGIFNDDSRRWRRKPLIKPTWREFKIFFTQMHNKQRHFNGAAVSGGFKSMINNVFGEVHFGRAPAEDDVEDTAEVLQAIAEGFEAHREEMAQLEQANATLATVNSTMMAQVKKMQAQMKRLQEQMSKLQGSGKAAGPAREKESGADYVFHQVNPERRKKYTGPWSYCWPHGLCNHKSQYPAVGHKCKGMMTNQMGGFTEGLK